MHGVPAFSWIKAASSYRSIHRRACLLGKKNSSVGHELDLDRVSD